MVVEALPWATLHAPTLAPVSNRTLVALLFTLNLQLPTRRRPLRLPETYSLRLPLDLASMVNSKLFFRAANTTLLVLRGRMDVAIQVNSNSVFQAANMMLLVLHGRTD